ncbi:bifunctional pantoate--beta-alanine ligase/(d)CMP kinase [Gloeocapsopsis dulcis]|uniref:Bifunctional pantoate ligase/cytidylate kinase n=1 Tax=Gloeocapsopsis dulcis AAB1 = 1H9 TaxID=1433147 RepID=A0A6N8FTQ7_9CHRO|nr:bifunctional pantoate--beta-alanine ligase/(d)CMP kinase [Gloeocapsopsis dulcis]MUL36331.1 cytidylate kinase [Gloeocapsopsis dulcis AAB1 = 1H9]WNN92006.1 bifunctional pantoate--beta-alanine ligase/(d)CMP kinase [Gloeocapsopsis dulcis]
MRLFTTIAALRCYLDCRSADNHLTPEELSSGCSSSQSVGLVPTMGALHAGHLSLIQRARQENETVIVSIFVNPLQFGPNEDYQSYPRTLERDRELCKQVGVDALFVPTPAEMGIDKPSTFLTQVIPPIEMTSVLCGRSRPGHFQGVATIVTKLLNVVQPDRAYFGQKDGQQLAIIRRVVNDLNIPVEMIGCPIVRETSGLAMSSRNQYLTPAQREEAAVLYRSLQQAKQAFDTGEYFSKALIETVKKEVATASAVTLEYVELVHPLTLMPLEKIEESGMLAIAARVGTARLIDNVILQNRQPIIAIDGPAGAGKSTVARQVAAKLGLLYLDTGAMYRALTWLVLQLGISFDDCTAIAELASLSQIQLVPEVDLESPQRVWINNQEVTQAIRTIEVTSQVSAIAAQPAVRKALVQKQQAFGKEGGLVAEGRDIGTQVFPDADLKIFLTASVQERAKRRQQDFEQGQINISLTQLEKDIAERDKKDSTREVSPLQKAADAIEVQTDGKKVAEVIAEIIDYYHQRLSRQ